MASLNLSTNGPSIKSSYQGVVNATIPSSGSPTYAQWALFSVQAPLLNAFQNTGAKESVLKVESTGEGELADLNEDFNEGRIQFAYLKVKDPNSGLPKNVLIAWCGGGVPERTKGYFTSHLAAVSKILHGYHVQITARSDDDIVPETILQKVADASGANYSGGSSAPAPAPRPAVASKPVFSPSTTGATRFNPLVAARNRKTDEDNDGWGADAPQVTRTQLEKVAPAYKPTKVNMAELTKSKPAEPSGFSAPAARSPDVIGGGYQPVGKVDIAAIRAAAKNQEDTRPTVVQGAYEPVGKVDIAAIRARAQPQKEEKADEPEPPRSLADRTAAFSQPQESERLTSLPKPRVVNKFGSSGPSFTGTKPPAPFNKPAVPAPPVVGAASRTFADQGGKTPAQIWAEKKAKKDGLGAPSATVTPPMASPIASQKSGSEWKSGYAGKSWTVQAPGYSRELSGQATGDSAQSTEAPQEQEAPASPAAGGVSALKDRFKDAQPIAPSPPSAPPVPSGVDRDEPSPPPLPSSTRPDAGFPVPGLPSRPPPPAEEDSYEEERERSPSPPRIAVPVARSQSPPPEPVRDLPVRPREEPEPPRPEPPRPEPVQERESYAAPAVAAGVAAGVGVGVAAAAAAAYDGDEQVAEEAAGTGPSAVALYDYEKAEDNEIELREDEYVVDIDMVDEDWWVGTNSAGDRGLFPSNYVQLAGDDQQAEEAEPAHAPAPAQAPQMEEPPAPSGGGRTATALYDYEAAEDNELTFNEGDIITDLEFPDDDWWLGQFNNQQGLFPANYVQLNE